MQRTQCKTIGRLFASLLPLLSAVGCASRPAQIEPAESPCPADIADTEALAETAAPGSTIIGRSVEGRPITCRVLGYGPDVSLFIATIHGNESGGTPMLRRLGDHLAENPDLLVGRRVILVPLINPDGLDRYWRYNARGVDLNRNFPAANWSKAARSGEHPLSEPEAQVICDLLRDYRPRRVITIHEILVCIDYDGPGEPLARAMAACSDLPIRRLGGLPGSLGSYVSETFCVPIVTVELRRFAHRLPADVLWDRYRDMLLAAVTFGDASLSTAGG